MASTLSIAGNRKIGACKNSLYSRLKKYFIPGRFETLSSYCIKAAFPVLEAKFEKRVNIHFYPAAIILTIAIKSRPFIFRRQKTLNIKNLHSAYFSIGIAFQFYITLQIEK
jgi:hypothetical protein